MMLELADLVSRHDLVNCKDCANSTIAVRRLHEGALYFQEALMQAAIHEAKER
jgi:hypothetical protein